MGFKKPWHPEMNRFLAMSGNLFIRAIALNTTIVLAVREAAMLGAKYVAAHTIAIQLWLFSSFFIDGYGSTGNILGGMLIGAKDYKNLVKMAKRVATIGVLIAFLLGGIALINTNNLGLLFSKDKDVLLIFNGFFYLVVICLPVNAIAFIGDGLFKGMGEMRYLRNIFLFSTFFGFIPTLILSHYLDWQLHGIWIAITIWMMLRGLTLFIKFKRKYIPLAS